MLKRVKSMRDNTKEGCFGSVPYSFSTSAMRSRSEVSFCVSLLKKKGAWKKTEKNVLRAFWAIFLYYILFDVRQEQGHMCITSFSM